MIPTVVHESWHDPLKHLFEDDRLKEIQKALGQIKNFSPAALDIFKAFSLPIGEIKVVIVGLSVYNQVGVIEGKTLRYATGLAFATPGFKTESLKVIENALWNDYRDITVELDSSLEHWHNQGVMLLNKSLTVEIGGDARGHLFPFSKGSLSWPGWIWFTSEVIRIIDEYCNAVIFAFLGKDACEYKELVSAKNYILEAPHPAAGYYWKKNNPGKVLDERYDFSKRGLFNEIDEITMNIDKSKIQWF